MAFVFQQTYSPEIERLLYHYYQSLSEKDRRRFAALEAIKLGHGGIRSIAKVLACDPQTVNDGMQELKQLPDDPAGSRVRKPGGGRKKTEVKHVGLLQQVQDTMKDRIAGDPMRQDVVWTDLTPKRLPKVAGNTPSVPAPASCAVCSMDSVWPGAKDCRCSPEVTPRIAMRSCAIWPISSKRFSPLATRS